MTAIRDIAVLGCVICSLACAPKTAEVARTTEGAVSDGVEDEVGWSGPSVDGGGPDAKGLRISPDYQPPLIGDPSRGMIVLGALEAAIIERGMEQQLPKLVSCFSREATHNPNLAGGKLVVKFTIAGNGSVSKSELISQGATQVSETLQECVGLQMQRFQFPAPKGGGIVIVKYPIQFNSRD